MLEDHSAIVLLDLPINKTVDIDGVQICLTVSGNSATLSAELPLELTVESTQRCLELGFSNALEFDAGLAIDPAQHRLVLTHWLSGASNWADAESALESLLNQVDVFRAALQIISSRTAKVAVGESIRGTSRQREEGRLRARLTRG